MERGRYRFRSEWRVGAPAAVVYAALERAEDYPSWWPQVREVRRLDDAGGEGGTARFRSFLPYDLEVTARLSRRDPSAGVLRISMAGDLEGWARWTVRKDPAGEGTLAVFTQEVEVRKPLLRLLDIPGRPFFCLNHALMMRAGRRGLRRWLRTGFGDE